ncbi:MAG: hypothetical protein U0790_23625 [Isosphaeraceae bacterium]
MAWIVPGELLVLVVLRGERFRSDEEALIESALGEGIEGVGVGELLPERFVEPLELGLRELGQPGAEDAADGQAGQGQPGHPGQAELHRQRDPDEDQQRGHEDPGLVRGPFIDFGMTSPSRIRRPDWIRPRCG